MEGGGALYRSRAKHCMRMRGEAGGGDEAAEPPPGSGWKRLGMARQGQHGASWCNMESLQVAIPMPLRPAVKLVMSSLYYADDSCTITNISVRRARHPHAMDANTSTCAVVLPPRVEAAIYSRARQTRLLHRRHQCRLPESPWRAPAPAPEHLARSSAPDDAGSWGSASP